MDETDWKSRKKSRVLALQRQRRKKLRRIDFYPSEETVAVIDRMRTRFAGGDASSILNRIVSEWATVPEFNTSK